MTILAPGIQLIDRLCLAGKLRRYSYTILAFLVSYLAYVGYHMGRVPVSVVENDKLFLDCSTNSTEEDPICTSWITEMDQVPKSEARRKLGYLKTFWGFAYAIFMFLSGYIGDRMELRHFLSGSLLLYGVTVYLFGVAQAWGIHSIWYFYAAMFLQGALSSTGWPGVVAAYGNWVGEGTRGTLMGVWTSNAFVGNILGRELAGDFLGYGWGNSFALLALIIGVSGFVVFLFLVPNPSDVGVASESASINSDKEIAKADTEDHDNAVSFLQALLIPGVIEFSLCLFFSKFVIYTFLFWLPSYIHDMSGVDAEGSGSMANFFEYGGIIGGILAGFVTDKTGKSALVCGCCLLLAIPLMLIYETMVRDWCPLSVLVSGTGFIHDSCYGWNIFLLTCVGILVSGPYALITSAISADLGTQESLQGSKALATVSAIINGTGSIGGALGPFTAGYLPARYLFTMVMVSDAIALLFLSRLIKQDIQKIFGNGDGQT